MDTSGYASKKIFKIALFLVDYVLFDVKHMDSEEHKKYTGVSNEIILENLKVLVNSNIPFVVRVPLIPGVNDSAKHSKKIYEFVKNATFLKRVEFLPFL